MPLNWNTIGLAIISCFLISFAIYGAYKFPLYRVLFWFCSVIFMIVYGGILISIFFANR